jgi:hypothetical protein
MINEFLMYKIMKYLNAIPVILISCLVMTACSSKSSNDNAGVLAAGPMEKKQLFLSNL